MKFYFPALTLLFLFCISCADENPSSQDSAAHEKNRKDTIPLVSSDPLSDTNFTGWKKERIGDFTLQIPASAKLEQGGDSLVLQWKERTITFHHGENLPWGIFETQTEIFQLATPEERKKWLSQRWTNRPLHLLDSLPAHLPHHALFMSNRHELRRYFSFPSDSIAAHSEILICHQSTPASLQVSADSLDEFERNVLLKMLLSIRCTRVNEKFSLLSFRNDECGGKMVTEYKDGYRIKRPAGPEIKKDGDLLQVSYSVTDNCASPYWQGFAELRNDTVFLHAKKFGESSRSYDAGTRSFTGTNTWMGCSCSFCMHYIMRLPRELKNYVIMIEGVTAKKYQADALLKDEIIVETPPAETRDSL